MKIEYPLLSDMDFLKKLGFFDFYFIFKLKSFCKDDFFIAVMKKVIESEPSNLSITNPKPKIDRKFHKV